jgi:dihydroorotase-like cyclic amidohydrolase
MSTVLIRNAKIVNEGVIFEGDILIENEFIKEIAEKISPKSSDCVIIDAEGSYVMPGAIDDQVHFREPGLTHKGNIETESRAAVAGGITSFIEQPNTVPNAVTQELLEDKYQIASQKSFANYSFMMGGTNDNLEEVLKTNPRNVAGIKLFLGSSTGNMLVDNPEVLTDPEIFKTKLEKAKKKLKDLEKKAKEENNKLKENKQKTINKINQTDSDSRLMQMKRKDYANGYNCQIITENQFII